MLVFVALAVMVWHMGQQRKGTVGPAGAEKAPVWRTVVKAFPLFILGFLALAVLNTLVDFSSVSLLGTTLADLLKTANKYLITVALVGVGCKISLRDLFTKGYKPVLLGGCTWLAVAVVTLSYVIFLM